MRVITVNDQAVSMLGSGDYIGVFPAGAYEVKAVAPGYQEQLYPGVVIQENSTTTQDFVLSAVVGDVDPVATIVSPSGDITVSQGNSIHFQGVCALWLALYDALYRSAVVNKVHEI